MNYKRVLIEKNELANVEAKGLLKEFRTFLGIESLEAIRVINVYDLVNATELETEEIIAKILYEPQIDYLYRKMPELKANEKAFRVEYHKGQYNQREDSTQTLIQNYLDFKDVEVLNSKIIILKNVDDNELDRIKSYYINPIEAKEIDIDDFTYEKLEEANDDIEIVYDFISMDKKQMLQMKTKYGLGLDLDDLIFCQEYFKTENRNPSIAELKIIDTYWSDHCRHTTFMTEITDIKIAEGKYKEIFEYALKKYLSSREYVYEDNERPICLMDLATINMKETKKLGLLEDKEDSDEVNAASIVIDVDIDGKTEKWLLMFKNETHNHPTEMEPFGGAATCLGGGIRDPLSGRAFVYQAMRITGSGDPRQKFEDTLPGKLSQRKITRTAMEGYSSYGNQIGAATGYISEFYDEGFVAKRLELGALVAAAPKDWVYRGTPKSGDLVILVGGRTGRDGLGGAVGSSKVQTEDSLYEAGAEVQKGNPSIERKIIRLFRNPEATKLIIKCNDFGAGGVAVAVGELADGLYIDLDKVPAKYPGLNGGEIALSESQERMAIVIDKENLEKFMELIESEDLEGTVIAEVTDEYRVHMVWRGNTIVDIKREFLDTNGIRKKSKVMIEEPEDDIYLCKNPKSIEGLDVKDAFIKNLIDLNIASQKGLVEKFDSTIGSGAILMQLGGKYKLTPQEGMVAKIPVLSGETNTCSIMTCGYDPKLAKWSPFHGGYYAVIESIAKIVALGGDYRKIKLTFQEYFERLGDDPSKWGKPFASLLGAYLVQKELDIASIGGKDSMSGSFEDINVPPSLFSFAVVADKVENIVSKEFKKKNSKVVLISLNIDEKGMVDFTQLRSNYGKIKELINNKKVLASSSIKYGGIARSIAEMCFGNKIGFSFAENIKDYIFKPLYGSIILELDGDENLKELLNGVDYKILGRTIDKEEIKIDNQTLTLNNQINKWLEILDDTFPINKDLNEKVDNIKFTKNSIIKNTVKALKPKVLIPIFTGSHGEYDMAQSFRKAGAVVEEFVFKAQSPIQIQESYRELAKKINECQILGLANGSLLGDEPETGGKLIKVIFSNPFVKEAVNNHLKVNDGLILGIGDGFQALIKLGLIEFGEITEKENSVFISYNNTGDFISTTSDVKVISRLSPWMSGMDLGHIYTVPVATKEGRIILNKGSNIISNGQIATEFINNYTGSFMNIESLSSPDGRVLGTIASIDRMDSSLYKNIEIRDKHNIFQLGVKYFR